jgi:hypothetical protein
MTGLEVPSEQLLSFYYSYRNGINIMKQKLFAGEVFLKGVDANID